MAAVYQAGLLPGGRGLLRALGAAHLAATVLVAETGRGRRGPMHLPDAVPLLVGDMGFRAHAHARGDHVDEGPATPVVLHHVWRLLLCRVRLGCVGGGLDRKSV